MTEKNIDRLQINGKDIILIGTAHVSKQSAELVREIIESEKPDSVCIELDEQRYESLKEDNRWKDMDIFKVIKEKKATLLLINLAVASFQKRMAKQFGINAGQEMIQAIDSATDFGANIVLADRNIQVTFARVWHGLGLWGKIRLIFEILFSIFSKETISEEEIENIKSQDLLDSMLNDFSLHFPRLKKPLIDERDEYLAQKIKTAPGDKIIAVLGAAHVPGVKREINKNHDLAKLSQIPAKSKIPKIIAWIIPIAIISIIAYTFYVNPSAGIKQTISWLIWNGSFASLGAAIALGHPLTILTAFVAAPITSLNPLLAAGWFAGAMQAVIKKPKVRDFENLSEDVYTLKGFWGNRVTRILLIVVLANLGSVLGTVIGGADVIRLFLNSF